MDDPVQKDPRLMPENKPVAGPMMLNCGCTYIPNDYHTEGERLFKCAHNRQWKMVLIRPKPFFMPIDITPENSTTNKGE